MMNGSNDPKLVTPRGESVVVEFEEKRRGEEKSGDGETSADEEKDGEHVVVVVVVVVVCEWVGVGLYVFFTSEKRREKESEGAGRECRKGKRGVYILFQRGSLTREGGGELDA